MLTRLITAEPATSLQDAEKKGWCKVRSQANHLEEEGELKLATVDMVAAYRFMGTVVTVKTKGAYGFQDLLSPFLTSSTELEQSKARY